MNPELNQLLDGLSRELRLACDAHGVLRQLDDNARRCFNTKEGTPFADLVAPGLQEKAARLLEHARVAPITDAELSMLAEGRVQTFSWSGVPDGEGGVALLGSRLPEDYDQLFARVQESLNEIVTLNRAIAGQKREVERHRAELQQQKAELEATNRALDDSNRGVLGLHAELAEKADTLQRTAEVKARVVANVSHEFRTPLHTILGLSKLLLDQVDGPLTAEQTKQVRFIRTSAEELSALVDDMLDLSRTESGKAIVRPTKWHVSELFAAMRGMLRPLLQADRPVELLFESPTPDITLETDQAKVTQILRNLVSNALKFTVKGHVKVRARQDRDRLVIETEDTGIGIAPEHHDRVFEEFGQVESDLQRQTKGTGLGLPLSRRLAELLGGTLTVRSRAGEGSVFTLSLPLVHPEVAELSRMSERPLDPWRAPILVVEDDRKTIFVYERTLSMAGFQVIPARTVDEARKLLEKVRPAAIVLDIMLEGESSWRFLAEVKNNPATHDIPVLVVTVSASEQKARALGADEFWLKPVKQDLLLRKLHSIGMPSGAATVLVIDDDERARYLVAKFLEGSPFRLLQASNGPAGVALAREQKPSVILLDFLLEDMTAFDVLDELKSNPLTRTIPVIVVTSHVLGPQQRERLASESEAILSKQNLSRELAINRIRDALRKAGLGEAAARRRP